MLAIDCDLHRLHCWSTLHGKVCTKAPDLALIKESLAADTGVALFEIAAPVSFMRGQQATAPTYQLARWALWNVAQAALLWYAYPDRLLVAPSNIWTKGLPLAVRHKLAGADQKLNKDLRECQAMLWSYSVEPALWKPFDEYLRKL